MPSPALPCPAELTCPYATGSLACIKPGYTVPRDLTARFQAALPADAVQLSVLGFEGGSSRRFLDVLPLADMVALLNGRLPPELHACTVPALPAGKVLGYANTPGSPMHAALRACRLAPLPTDRNLVFGAIAPR